MLLHLIFQRSNISASVTQLGNSQHSPSHEVKLMTHGLKDNGWNSIYLSFILHNLYYSIVFDLILPILYYCLWPYITYIVLISLTLYYLYCSNILYYLYFAFIFHVISYILQWNFALYSLYFAIIFYLILPTFHNHHILPIIYNYRLYIIYISLLYILHLSFVLLLIYFVLYFLYFTNISYAHSVSFQLFINKLIALFFKNRLKFKCYSSVAQISCTVDRRNLNVIHQ